MLRSEQRQWLFGRVLFIIVNIKMYTNESAHQTQFLLPSSIPRILQSNRQFCALHSLPSTSLTKTFISPNQNQPQSDYTFEPKVNSSHKGRRSLQKFMEDQDKFKYQKQRKVTEMRQEITRWEDQEIRDYPQINSNFKSRASGKAGEEDVFNRLSRQKLSRDLPLHSYSFKPCILPKSKGIYRQKPATDLLYQDAKRRQSKQNIIRQSESKKINSLSIPRINANTNDLVRRKMLTEFMQLISDSVINPLLALSVLQELFNVRLREVESPFVQRLIQLLVTGNGEVLTQKLWSFIAIIIGNSEGCFPEEQEEEIRCTYGHFYKERINKQRKLSTPEIPQFHPKTLDNADRLAERYRERQCRKVSEFIQDQHLNVNIINDTITLEDLYTIQHRHRLKESQKLKQQQQNRQMAQCTFKPKLTDNKPSSNTRPKIVLKHPLRQKHTNLQSISNQPTERTRLQSILPSTTRPSLSRQKKASIYNRNRRSVDNLSERLRVGRTSRQLKDKMCLRSYSKDQNWTIQYAKKHKKLVNNIQKLRGLPQQ